jgi:uracil-DNA glycosylase family 4
MANTVAEINREIVVRARQLGLEVDCGSDGIFNAEVAIIGEAPGEREDIMKMPLVGNSGKYLWNELRKYGINRRQVYISNVVKRKLQSVNVGEMKGKKDIGHGELSHYSSILLWELSQLPNLKYVICLGNYALTAITGLSGITAYRGSVMDVQLGNTNDSLVRDVKVVCLLNPAAVLRNVSNELMFKFDCKRINDVITGQYEYHEINHIINPTLDEALAWIERMRTEGKPVGLDIETSSGETICVGLANDPHEGMCINFRTADANRWTVREEVQLWTAIQQLVDDESVRLVEQNGMYDSSWLWFHDRIRTRAVWFDTMLAHHTLYPTMPHNLGFITTQYTTHPYYKDDGKLWKETGDINQEWRYNIKDVCLMLESQQGMLKELEQQGLSDFFFDHVMPIQRELVDMTVHGVKIDVELKNKIAEELKIEIGKMRHEYFTMVQSCTGDPDYRPNPNSPKQMAELFFKRLRLVGRGVATDKENRRRMYEHPRTPDDCKALLKHIDKMAVESKFASTYAEMSIDGDGRIRSEYKQTGVQSAPGRLSSASTGWGTGANLQNQPPRAHQMFVADEGHEFNYFDLGQAEARVVGWRAVIPEWMEQFEQSRVDGVYDSHRALAAQMFNKPYDEVPKSDFNPDGSQSIRYRAKRCRHALNYGLMPDGLATQLEISYSEAEYLWNLYFKVNPRVIEWQKWTVEQFKTNRQMFNAFGRRLILLEQWDDAKVLTYVAFYPQSTIGDKVVKIIKQCHNDPEWPRGEARIALNIHDALIALNTHHVGAEVRGIMQKYATEPILIEGMDGEIRELIIPCDLKKSSPDDTGVHRWSTLEKVK